MFVIGDFGIFSGGS